MLSYQKDIIRCRSIYEKACTVGKDILNGKIALNFFDTIDLTIWKDMPCAITALNKNLISTEDLNIMSLKFFGWTNRAFFSLNMLHGLEQGAFTSKQLVNSSSLMCFSIMSEFTDDLFFMITHEMVTCEQLRLFHSVDYIHCFIDLIHREMEAINGGKITFEEIALLSTNHMQYVFETTNGWEMLTLGKPTVREFARVPANHVYHMKTNNIGIDIFESLSIDDMIAIPHINFLCLIRSKYGLIALKSGLIKIREIAMLSEVQLNYLVNRQEGYKCLCKHLIQFEKFKELESWRVECLDMYFCLIMERKLITIDQMMMIQDQTSFKWLVNTRNGVNFLRDHPDFDEATLITK